MWHVKRKLESFDDAKGQDGLGGENIFASGREILEDSDVNRQACRDKSVLFGFFLGKAAKRETFRPKL